MVSRTHSSKHPLPAFNRESHGNHPGRESRPEYAAERAPDHRPGIRSAKIITRRRHSAIGRQTIRPEALPRLWHGIWDVRDTNVDKITDMNDDILLLLEKIYDCQTCCKYCFNACLEETDIAMMRVCIRLSVECAEVCELTASSLAFAGNFTADCLAVCIRTCEMCAEACRQHRCLHCYECAKTCSECAEACRRYIVAAATA